MATQGDHAPPGRTVTQDDMLKVLDRLRREDVDNVFGAPVDIILYPTYLQTIAQPRDLGTIRSSLLKGVYANAADEFRRDIGLVFRNCMQFNAPASSIFQLAAHMARVADSLFGNLGFVGGVVSKRTLSSGDRDVVRGRGAWNAGSTATSSASSSKRVAGSRADGSAGAALSDDRYLAHCQILTDLWNADRYDLFKVPAPSDPEYLAVISNPMDLGVVQKRLHGLHYATDAEFKKDLLLIFSNANNFHPKDSDIARNARQLTSAVHSAFAKHLPGGRPATKGSAASFSASALPAAGVAADLGPAGTPFSAYVKYGILTAGEVVQCLPRHVTAALDASSVARWLDRGQHKSAKSPAEFALAVGGSMASWAALTNKKGVTFQQLKSDLNERVLESAITALPAYKAIKTAVDALAASMSCADTELVSINDTLRDEAEELLSLLTRYAAASASLIGQPNPPAHVQQYASVRAALEEVAMDMSSLRERESLESIELELSLKYDYIAEKIVKPLVAAKSTE